MIDDIVFTYDKMHRHFKKPVLFTSEETTPCGGISHDESRKTLFSSKNPKNITLGNIPEYSEHGVKIFLSNL